MPLHSAGILLYRMAEGSLQVLLVHPGGPYFAQKDAGVWSIPKGLFEADEEALAAAKREFMEELGTEVPATQFTPLLPVRQKGGKIVYAWAAQGDIDASTIVSNTFRMEYPYKSGNWQKFPEVDRAAWFNLDEAEEHIIVAQASFLHQLDALLRKG